jgi:hypothetical protein
MTVPAEVWGILGGGFGLYGYLPAVACRTGDRIHTLRRYQETIRRRADIKTYEDRVIFEKDIGAILNKCNALAVAVRPADQEQLLNEVFDLGWKGKIILEKPLARNPGLADALLQRLMAADIDFRIAFTLNVTPWSARLAQFLAANETEEVTLDIEWQFHAHHYRRDLDIWKRHPSQGGGATRFYAIHLIALLAGLDLTTPLRYSRLITGLDDEPECRFAVSGARRTAAVKCNSRWEGEPGFSIRGTVAGAAAFEVKLGDPFGDIDGVHGIHADGRIQYLLQILESFDGVPHGDARFYVGHVKLWSELEKIASPWGGAQPASGHRAG